MLLLGRLTTHMAQRRRAGKSISVSGDRGDNAITKKREREKNMTRFGFLDGCQHSRRRKSGSNCLKTEEEPHKLIV
jgi:hypothetical protein